MTAREIFLADLKSDRLHHAYLIAGTTEQSVEELIDFCTMAIMCENKADAPCGECLGCRKVINKTHADAVKNTSKKLLVDDIQTIIEDSYIRPIDNDRKVYSLINFDHANEKAQNKLLKTLEEPVKNTVFLLGCKNANGILPTIKSRTKKLEIFETLTASTSPESTVILDAVADMYRNMRKSSQILDYANMLSRYRDLSEVLGVLELYTRDIILAKTENENLLLYKHKKNDIIIAGEDFSLAALGATLKNILAAQKNANFNINISPTIDYLLYSILEEKHKCP